MPFFTASWNFLLFSEGIHGVRHLDQVVPLGAHDLPVALAAARRQLSADTARFATLAHELGLAEVTEPGQRGETLDEYAADEVRAVLAISRTAAWTLLHRAHDTTHRLPNSAPPGPRAASTRTGSAPSAPGPKPSPTPTPATSSRWCSPTRRG